MCPCSGVLVKRKRVIWVLCSVLVCACTSRQSAPVDVRPTEPLRGTTAGMDADSPVPRTYRVANGDTLYAIAVGHGLNYLDLSAWNGIPSPYVIYPGQLLQLFHAQAQPAAVAMPQTGRHISQPLHGTASLPVRKPQRQRQRQRQPAGSKVRESMPGWRWPTAGVAVPVASVQTGTAPRGINIRGQSGQEIRAAAMGEVVHSGPLKHYGKMVILRHPGEYLSVYGYNSEVFVTEGDRVEAEQRIARMGDSPAGDPVLHFEIILPDGESADPRKFLPARQITRTGSQG